MRVRWMVRTAMALLVFGILDVSLTAFDFEPEPLRLGVLVALLAAVMGLVRDSLGESGPTWTAEPVRSVTPPGADSRLAGYVRLIEGHLTAATPDTGLRERLRALADEALDSRRGLRRGDPEAEALLGPDLVADLRGDPRRIGVKRIDDHLKRIEEL